MNFNGRSAWITVALLASATAVALPNDHNAKRADTVTANVYLTNSTGTPTHFASGILYGMPDAADQIPDSFYDEMGFCYARAGGAQVPEPGRGWIWGLTEYQNRFASALSNYQTTIEHGGTFIFTIHDLWGFDGSQSSSALHPGDDGNWTAWDNYLDQWISDMETNDALTNLVVDLWNEPDLGTFWRRDQDQYLEMFAHTYARLRDAWPDVPLSGPSTSSVPSEDSDWWNAFLSYVAENDVVPDQWSWHMETHTHNMDSDHGSLLAMLNTYGLPEKQININEYGVADQQNAAGAAWFISQLERHDAYGVRGNWESGWELHDYLASLLGKPGAGTDDYNQNATGYYPNGEYQVYKYYALSMTGTRVGILPSSDTFLDAYATVDDKLRILAGVRPSGGEGTWTLTINNLSELGYDTSGSVDVQTYGFPWTGAYDEVDEPTDLGVATLDFSDDIVTISIDNADTNMAYAFEIDLA